MGCMSEMKPTENPGVRFSRGSGWWWRSEGGEVDPRMLERASARACLVLYKRRGSGRWKPKKVQNKKNKKIVVVIVIVVSARTHVSYLFSHLFSLSMSVSSYLPVRFLAFPSVSPCLSRRRRFRCFLWLSLCRVLVSLFSVLCAVHVCLCNVV